jgi:hypothetical protein
MKMTRGRLILVALLAALLAAGAAAYMKWPYVLESFRKTATTAPSGNQVFATPPFSTKEPDRYQATRVITTGEGAATQTYTIARDGENRREETNNGAVYLESRTGSFLLYPAGKLYADLNADSGETVDAQRNGDFSPDRLLHETSSEARYQLLGSESLAGRKTTKYKVAPADWHGESTVGLIWVDDELGMPIKSEMVSTNSEAPLKVTMELREIRLDVDPRLFELPADYTKVSVRDLLVEVSRSRSQGKSKSRTP